MSMLTDYRPLLRIVDTLREEVVVSGARRTLAGIRDATNENDPYYWNWPETTPELSMKLRTRLDRASLPGNLLHNFFSQHVVPRLSGPLLANADDLCDAFVDAVRCHDDAFQRSYECFVGLVATRAAAESQEHHFSFFDHDELTFSRDSSLREPQDSEPAEGTDTPERLFTTTEERSLWDDNDSEAIWTGNGLQLRLEPQHRIAESAPARPLLRAAPGLFQPVRRIGVRLVGPICRWAALALDDAIGSKLTVVAGCAGGGAVGLLPFLRIKDLLSQNDVIRELIDCLLGAPDSRSKDEMARRIQNSIQLLDEAERQSSAGVALALTVTALEALLSKAKSEIASTLAQSVAVLLEPDLANRQRAEEFVKRLYDKRSRVLHGDTMGQAAEDYYQARWLAYRVLAHLTQRRVFFRRLGDESLAKSHEALLSEMRESKYQAHRMPWQDKPDLVRQLWNDGR